MQTIFIKTLLILSFFSLGLVAGENTRIEKSKEYSGYGANKTEALQNALIEAVKQKNGGYISSVKKVFRSYSQNSIATDVGSASVTSMKDGMRQKLKIATSGFISSYDILDMIKHPDDYEAVIRVYTVEYRTPGNSAHKRRKMVIVPSYTENIAFNVLGKRKTPKDVSYNLAQELTNTLTQTRKFSVLDRANQRAYASEKQLILSPNAHKDEILKLAQVLGADYLVVSTIKELKITNTKKMIRSIGREVSSLKAYATVNYQILTMATRQIKWSNTMDFEFKPKGKSDQQIFYNTLRKISQDLTNEIIENIYPIRISKISGNGDAILSQSAKLGTMYDVFDLGEKLFDPYTKEFLGYDEVYTGRIEVVRSLAKVAYGRIIQGEVYKNNICRKTLKKSREKRVAIGKSRSNAREPHAQMDDGKKYIAIKSLSISSGIDKYKHKVIKDANIALQIKNAVNKSKKYRVLTRDKEQAAAMMDENEFAKSDISDSMDESSMKFSNVDYQLLPKVTKFKYWTSSKKIPDIDAYENQDYIKLEMNIVVIDRQGEVIFESTKTEKYSRSWGSESKLKRKRPSYKAVSTLATKLTSKVLYDLLNKKAEMLSAKFITVVEVGKRMIYLDLGENMDVQEGDEYPVYKEPVVKTIKRTGKTRLSYGEKIATIRIDAIYDDGAEAVVVRGKISKIKEGYVLRVKKRRK
ncbi:hypothetical protein JHD48_05805 [Sulfurimonas sp. SAG-AH-194-I05]|nr:CsgG/HfaB family protein [Sulfurimonas sp. SAG-AH-194-I05]MDF1875240.1 hypothetical protein [Sulfurimonas sp. SAG-AH-194-I05]